jgi:hypothetical protein
MPAVFQPQSQVNRLDPRCDARQKRQYSMNRLRLGGSLLAAALLVACVQSAAAQEERRSRLRDPQPPAWEESPLNWDEMLASAEGMLFVNGQFVPSPCQLRVRDQSLYVNDLPVTSRLVDSDDERPFRRPRPGGQARRVGNEIASLLSARQIVVALEGQPLVAVHDLKSQCDLLCALGAKAPDRVQPVASLQYLPPGIDEAAWDQWIAAFVPTEDFQKRAGELIAFYNEMQRASDATIAANRRLHEFSYPLSVLGMIGAVLGFGHLLSHRPPVGAQRLATDASPLAMRMVIYSLGLVVLFSGLDLAWTILAHQAGQMLELNPLGSRLVEDPLKLIAFKVGATGMAVGLLFCLRKYCQAQLAAWWICLVLTLLTARWLTLNSMFIA